MKDFKTSKNIWGTICTCGKEVFAFQDKHPWGVNKDEKLILTCKHCNKNVMITSADACKYYNNKIFDLFKDVRGSVLEIGCGGGTLTRYLSSKKEITKLIAVDRDVANQETDDAQQIIQSLGCDYINVDLDDFDETIFNQNFDFVVCRDVVMYLGNLNYTFKKLSKITKNMVLLNWHNSDHKNCINKTDPKQFIKILKKYFNTVKISYPDFYKWGYLIKCFK